MVKDAHGRHLIKLGGIVIFCLIAGAAFSLFVDPIGIFRSPLIEGVTAQKPEKNKFQGLFKIHDLTRLKPGTLVMGSSRAMIGLDPTHEALHGGSEERYNLAMPGTNNYTILRYLQHTDHLVPVNQVVVGLDFSYFNVHSPTRGDFDEGLFAVNAAGEPNTANFKSSPFSLLFSIDMYRSALNTVLQQVPNPSSWYNEYGMREKMDPQNAPGAKGAIDRFNSSINTYRHNTWFPPPMNKYSSVDASGETVAYEDFRRVLDFSRKNDIDLRLFISPAHALMLEGMKAGELWDDFEGWKRALVKVIEEEAAASGKPPFPLWDFSGYNSITTEEVPPPDKANQKMRWYWEAAHYKKETGDLVLDKIFGFSGDERTVPEDFGIRIGKSNVEAHLEQTNRAREEYKASHRDFIATIEAIAKRRRRSAED